MAEPLRLERPSPQSHGLCIFLKATQIRVIIKAKDLKRTRRFRSSRPQILKAMDSHQADLHKSQPSRIPDCVFRTMASRIPRNPHIQPKPRILNGRICANYSCCGSWPFSPRPSSSLPVSKPRILIERKSRILAPHLPDPTDIHLSQSHGSSLSGKSVADPLAFQIRLILTLNEWICASSSCPGSWPTHIHPPILVLKADPPVPHAFLKPRIPTE